MTRAYNVVDADGHILEPLDLWDRYPGSRIRGAPASVCHRVPEGKHQVLAGGALGFYGLS